MANRQPHGGHHARFTLPCHRSSCPIPVLWAPLDLQTQGHPCDAAALQPCKGQGQDEAGARRSGDPHVSPQARPQPPRCVYPSEVQKIFPCTCIKGAAGRRRRRDTGGTGSQHTMPPEAALLLTLLATIPVALAEPARSSFWEYLSQLTSDKDSPEHGQGSKLGRGMANPKGSAQDGMSYMGNFLEKLAPLNRGLQPRLSQDSESLRKLIRKELESLRVKLSPYVDEVHHKVGRHLEELRYRLQPFTEELLDQVSLKARELRRHLMPSREVTAQLLGGADEVQRFLAHYSDKIALHTEQVKGIFHPYADRLVTEIHRNVEELHRNVVPHSQASPEQLNQYIQELSSKLTQSARDLHHKIQGNLEQLKAKLSLYPGSLRERPPSPERYTEALAREVQRRVDEFRRDTYIQIQDFTRALDHETEEVRLKLSTRVAGDLEGDPPPVEDLHARLDALWRDLSRSLGERGGAGEAGIGSGIGSGEGNGTRAP